MREISETVGISKDCVGRILNEILGMRKLSALWMPVLLTSDNKRNRKTTSEQKFKSNEEVIPATEVYFVDLQKTCLSDGLKK